MHPFLPMNRLSKFALFRPQQLNLAVEPCGADYDRLVSIPQHAPDIARAELTRVLRLLEHARHVPAVGALIRYAPQA